MGTGGVRSWLVSSPTSPDRWDCQADSASSILVTRSSGFVQARARILNPGHDHPHPL